MAKKYYWLKLRESFFDDKKLKKLRSIAGGDTFTIIYLKMMLKSLQDNGVLYYEGLEDTFAKELAMDINEEPENVQVTVDFLLRVGLLEDKGEEFSMPDVMASIGSESESAERVRRFRANHKPAKALPENEDVTQCNVTCNEPVTTCNTEIDIEKRRDREETDKIREEKTPHGEFQNVLLSISDISKLRDVVGVMKTDEAIQYLDEWIEEDPKRKKDYKKKNHYLCIRRWVLTAIDERDKRSGNQNEKYSTASKMKPLEAFWEKKRKEIGDDS